MSSTKVRGGDPEDRFVDHRIQDLEPDGHGGLKLRKDSVDFNELAHPVQERINAQGIQLQGHEQVLDVLDGWEEEFPDETVTQAVKTNRDDIGKNTRAIGTWDDPANEGLSVRNGIEINQEDIEDNLAKIDAEINTRKRQVDNIRKETLGLWHSVTRLNSETNPERFVQDVDDEGNPVFQSVLDDRGNPVLEPVLDDEGKPVLDDGGNPVLVPKLEPKLVAKTMTQTIDENTNTNTENDREIGDWTAGTERDTNDTSVKTAIEKLEEKAEGDDKKLSDRIGDWTDGTDNATNATPLTTAIENEERDRKAADTALGGRIDTETTERKAADAAEAATREAADTALGARITNEAAASRARDDALGKRIDQNSEAIEDAIALSAAIPDSWLSDSENFALALGGGFTDGSSAFGGIGTFRISKNLSAYGGGSTLTDGGTWAAKGGVRLGW